jgi:hypothetical protein
MGYHAEHHLYPFFPFWQLPRAHGHLKMTLQRISPSHLEVNLGINPIVTKNRKTSTEYDSKPGVKWWRCTAKRQWRPNPRSTARRGPSGSQRRWRGPRRTTRARRAARLNLQRAARKGSAVSKAAATGKGGRKEAEQTPDLSGPARLHRGRGREGGPALDRQRVWRHFHIRISV